ncbi:Cytochrome P450 [Pyrenophora tritici-repentis]|nr:Cytochrome P450 [Pyrenophora tritici-repentis]
MAISQFLSMRSDPERPFVVEGFLAHAVEVFRAARALRIWPTFLQPIVHWFLQETSQLRRTKRHALHIMGDHLKATGGLLSQSDAWAWLKHEAGERPYDIVNAQLGLSIAAINTTAGFLTNVLYDLCAYSEYMDRLREEIDRVLGDGSIEKSKLVKLQLMDSFLKESQRLHPMALITMNRRAEENLVLSDGTEIPKGALLAVPTTMMQSDSTYQEAHVFKGDRFLRLKEATGDEKKHLLVTTSSEHIGFGHGLHACPGRFFVATEIKVLLIHLLRDYDWRFATAQDDRPANLCIGAENIPDPGVKIEFRYRKLITSPVVLQG